MQQDLKDILARKVSKNILGGSSDPIFKIPSIRLQTDLDDSKNDFL